MRPAPMPLALVALVAPYGPGKSRTVAALQSATLPGFRRRWRRAVVAFGLTAPLALTACPPKAPVAVEAPAPPAFGGTVVQSPLDQRSYELVRLDNGLRALLISDPDTDMAAAALMVHVGHYADPPERQGLAHFLEHMLFMGTEKYPDVEEYRRFVEDHGGMTNAGTGGEVTQYFFQVEHGALPGAFDRFAQFFVAPVLDPQYVERERNAVDSEYSLKLQDDARRARQVRKATTNPAHPESKFSVGNLETLGDREGDTVYDDLRALYAAEYRADRMTLAVLGRESLDDLRAMVTAGLSGVANPATAAPDAERPPPFLPEQLGVRVDVVPLEVRREVELQFPLPPEDEVWPARPISYVASVLGHEGEGTLFAALKAAGWIESLSAGTADPADDYDLFSVEVGLTEAGAAHVDEIVAAVFEALGKIGAAGVEPFRLAEDRTVRDLGFRFAEEARPVSAVQGAARALAYYPPEHVLDYWAQVGELDPALFASTVGALTPDNLRLVVTLPQAETDRVEPLYDVRYGIRPLTAEETGAFTAGSSLEFGLPTENPYLPDDTSLLAGEVAAVPARLSEEGDRLQLWHMQDPSFGVPRAMGVIDLWSPDPRADERSRVMISLLDRLIEDALQEFRYPLEEAGLDLAVEGTDRGITLRFWGYDDGQETMVRDLTQRIASFEVDPARFEIQRARAVREWRNVAQDWPISQARRSEHEALFPYAFQRERAIEIAGELGADDLAAFADRVRDGLGARVLVHGNLSADEARALAAIVEETLLAEGEAPAVPEVTVRSLRPGETVVRDLAIDHTDSTLIVVYQGREIDAETHARWMVLGQLLDTPFFTQLRTEQQLGYTVSAGYTSFDRLPGLRMAIQSGVAGPVTLLERVDAFLAAQRAEVEQLPPEAFETVRNGIVARLREKDTQLYRKSGRLADELDLGVTTFDWDEQVARAVEGLDRDTVAAFYREILASDDTSRLIVRSFGRNHLDEQASAQAGCPDTSCVSGKLGAPWKRGL
jgi:secreted Zn-dependent insulinase-like peptidase